MVDLKEGLSIRGHKEEILVNTRQESHLIFYSQHTVTIGVSLAHAILR
jgi:hypothetical protein